MRPRSKFRVWLLLGVAAGLMTAGLPHATARSLAPDSIAERVATSLEADPLFIHPDVEGFAEPDTDRLRRRMQAAEAGPIYIVVLPGRAVEESGESVDTLLSSIARTLDRPGTYAMVAGTEFRAGTTGSTPFQPGQVPVIADETVAADQGRGTPALLLDFVARLHRAAGEGDGTGEGGGGFGFLPLLLLVGGGWWLLSSARRHRRQAAEERARLQEVKRVALDDTVALGEDLRALDLDVEMPGADPRAKEHYVHAMDCYQRASSGLDRAARLDDLEPVTAALEEGRYALACARARLANGELPERRPPCFFDPRHGPSARDVEWAPEGGVVRKVPACETDAARIEQGIDPVAREIMVEGRMTPYWNAPFYYRPWIGGYFGAFGAAFLPGMLMGSMLGSGLGWGLGAWGAEDGGDSGDFGGGDFGGGDFGG